MSTVHEIEAAMKNLSLEELQQVREWLEDFVEDQREFTAEFEARIGAAEHELASGARPRVRRP